MINLSRQQLFDQGWGDLPPIPLSQSFSAAVFVALFSPRVVIYADVDHYELFATRPGITMADALSELACPYGVVMVFTNDHIQLANWAPLQAQLTDAMISSPLFLSTRLIQFFEQFPSMRHTPLGTGPSTRSRSRLVPEATPTLTRPYIHLSDWEVKMTLVKRGGRAHKPPDAFTQETNLDRATRWLELNSTRYDTEIFLNVNGYHNSPGDTTCAIIAISQIHDIYHNCTALPAEYGRDGAAHVRSRQALLLGQLERLLKGPPPRGYSDRDMQKIFSKLHQYYLPSYLTEAGAQRPPAIPYRAWLNDSEINLCLQLLGIPCAIWKGDTLSSTGWGKLCFPQATWDLPSVTEVLTNCPALLCCTQDHFFVLPFSQPGPALPLVMLRESAISQLQHILDHQWTAPRRTRRQRLQEARPPLANYYDSLDEQDDSPSNENLEEAQELNPDITSQHIAPCLPPITRPPLLDGEFAQKIWTVTPDPMSTRRDRFSNQGALRSQAAAREAHKDLRPFLPATHPAVHLIYANNQRQTPHVVLTRGKKVVTYTSIRQGTPLVAALGMIVYKKPKKSRRHYLYLGGNKWFIFSNALYDVGLVNLAAYSSATDTSLQPHNLTPHLRYARDARANCKWLIEDDQPILWPLRPLDADEEIVVLTPDSMTDTMPEMSTTPASPCTEPPLTDTYKFVKPSENIQTPPKPPKKRLIGQNHIRHGANLYLSTVNANGNSQDEPFVDTVVKFFKGPLKPHGLIITHNGVREEEAAYAKQYLEQRLAGMGAIVRVLPARPPIEMKGHRATRAECVGGSTVIFIPRPNITFRSVQYDPGQFGTITKVAITIGKSYTITWIGAYIPSSGTGPSSLRSKYEEWFDTHRRPNLSKEALRVEGTPFDAVKWNWMLISDYVMAGYYNPLHIGTILQLDANQEYNINDHGPHSLFSRTNEIGLHTSSVSFLNEYGVPHYNTFQPLSAKGTHIDFTFSNLDASWWRAAGSMDDANWLLISDHLPIFGGWAIPHICHRKRYRVQPARPVVKLDVSTDEKRESVLEDIATAYPEVRRGLTFGPRPRPGHEAGPTLECLSYRVVDMARNISKQSGKATFKCRTTHKSNSTIASRLHLQYLIKLHRALWQRAPPTNWDSRPCAHHTRKRLHHILKKWEKAEAAMAMLEGTQDYLDGGTGHPRTWWVSHLTPFHLTSTLTGDLAAAKTSVKKLLKVDERITIRQAIQWRDQQVAEGKFKAAIRSLLERNSRGSAVQEVMTSDGPTSDPELVHTTLTDGWEEIFLLEDDSLPVKLGLEPPGSPDNPLPAADTWEELLQDPAKIETALSTGPGNTIPAPLRHEIAKALCAVPQSAQFEEAVAAALAKPFSRPEFDKIIQKTRNTAPGLSGLTYQMLQLLPAQGKDDFFRLMHRMWDTKTVATFWQNKGLAGIPKAGRDVISGPADLRPIGLIEVTRKVWTRMVLGRIHGCLIQFPQLLQPNHCGGLANKGTDTALLQMMQIMEDFVEYDIDPEAGNAAHMLDFTSWDTTKAFDSVGFHLQYAAWRRIGIPRAIVNWMLNLDLYGKFVVLTPYAQAQLDKIRMPDPTAIGHHVIIGSLGFTPKKGFTQGDVKSPLSWITFFDILMTALNNCRPDEYPHSRTDHSRVDPIFPVAYIDDLSSFTSSREHTEALAAIVSAAHAFLGTEAATKKFRAITTRLPPGHLTIYKKGWVEHKVAFGKDTQRVRMLGTDICLSNTWTAQIKTVVHEVRGFIKLLRRKRAAPETKGAVIVTAVLTKYVFPATVSSWPWAGVMEISNALSYLLRDAYKLPVDFPYHLLHAQVGGLGLPRLATVALLNRERALIRCLNGPGPGRLAARGLLNRCLRHDGEDSGLSWGPVTATGYDPTSFAGAILFEGQRRGYTLHRSGSNEALLHVSDRFDTMSPALRYVCVTLDIQYLEELYQPREQVILPWTTQFPKLFTKAVQRELRLLADSLKLNTPIPVTRGHLLAFRLPSEPNIQLFSVDGIIGNSTTLAGRWYTVLSTDLPLHLPLLIAAPATQHGCIHSGRCEWDLFLSFGLGLAHGKQLRENGTPSYNLCGLNTVIRFENELRCPPRLHHLPIPKWARNLAQAILADHCPSVITTDGSSSRHIRDATEFWTHSNESVRGRASMILAELCPQGGHRLLEVVRILDLPTEIAEQPHIIELIMHVAALQVAAAIQDQTGGVPLRVESDCQSIFERAKKDYRKGANRSLSTKPLASLFRIINITKRTHQHITSSWIKAHPERSKPTREWTAADCRIFAADAYADPGPPGELPLKLRHYPVTPYETRVHTIPLTVPASEVLLGFCPEGEFYWTDRQGHIALEGIFRNPIAELHPYLATREANSCSKQKWSEAQLGVLPHIWKKKAIFPNRLTKKWAALQMWDKLPNFRNLSKWSREVPSMCQLCKQAIESQSHLALRCNHPAMSLLREVCRRQLLSSIQVASHPLVSSHIKSWISIVFRPESESQAQLMLGLLIARPFKDSLALLPASGTLTPGHQHQYLAALRALCPASLRFLDLIWQLRNSLHAAPEWKREWILENCDMDALLDLLKRPYGSNVTNHLARLSWTQPDRITSTGSGPTTSLLQAARATLPLGCYYDPPTQQIEAFQASPSPVSMNQVDVEIAQTSTLDLPPANDIDSDQPVDPEPPPETILRRNPTRSARPACRDISDYPLLSMDEPLPGRIPTEDAEALIAQGGPELIFHPLDHPHMWIRPSYHCPEGGFSIIFRLDSNVPRGHLMGIYCGLTNEVLRLSYCEAEETWSDSDYVMAYPHANYIVDGDLTSGATRVNEGFHTTNSLFVFNSTQRWVEWRLKGCGQPGYYEGLGNYTEPYKPSPYWTSQRVSLLPPATRALCRTFYSSERRPKVPQLTSTKKKEKVKTKKQKAAEAQEPNSQSIQSFFSSK